MTDVTSILASAYKANTLSGQTYLDMAYATQST